MAFRIKSIVKENPQRAIVTVEEIDAQSQPTGRTWFEKFSLVDKDWARLKTAIEKKIGISNKEAAEVEELLTEASDAKMDQLTPIGPDAK